MALLAAPGYLLSELLLGPAAARHGPRAGWPPALALSVPVLGGLVLYAAGVPLHKPAWLALLAGVTLAAGLASAACAAAAAAAGRPRPGAPGVPGRLHLRGRPSRWPLRS